MTHAPMTAHLSKSLARYLQLGDRERIHREAGMLWEEALGLVRIARWRALIRIDRFFTLFHPYAESSDSIRRLLRNTHEVWLLAATIGDRLERRSKEYLAQNEALHGYLLNRMGNYLVEREIRLMDSLIVGECAEKGLGTTRRYSPGYRDFPLEAQAVFVSMASKAIPELRLTTDCLLLPEKTVTAVKGIRGLPV